MRAFADVILSTERLALRPLKHADAEVLYAIFSDPAVMRYWSTPPWESAVFAGAFIAKDIGAMQVGEYLRLGIELTATSELVGICSLYDFMEQCKRAEMGYGMSSTSWGHGYMHEALSALLQFGFDELGLHRVEADVDPRNMASVKSLERLGFVKEGHLRERWIVDGEISDSGFYGLLRSDWLSRMRT